VQAAEVDTSAAEAYEAALVPGMMAPWSEAIVSEAQISEGMRVLDVACGTGTAARYAARRCGVQGKVVAVDIDRGMLEIAKGVSTTEGLSIEYEYASACELPFESESFDAVLCLQGLQYFPDRPKAMSEFHRVLRVNSPLIVMTWSVIQACKGHWAMVSALENRNIDAAAARKPFSLSDSGALRTLAEGAGFKQVAVRTEERPACFSSATSFVDAMLRGAPSTRQALERVPLKDWPHFLADVERMLAQWTHGSSLEFPMASHVLEARR
jgi:SAM-dependent methyltransferase